MLINFIRSGPVIDIGRGSRAKGRSDGGQGDRKFKVGYRIAIKVRGKEALSYAY
jgi:hypothetical protein